jgi:gliding motility-associated-like protein
MKKILLFIGFIFSSTVFSQTYNIQDENGNTINTCSGTFVDSGGVNGDYSSGESYQVTFCPDISDNYIQLDFLSFNIEGEPWDFMTIYNGIGTSGTVIANYGDNLPLINSTCGTLLGSSDTTGCMTIVFESDSSLQYLGWEATISCTTSSGGDSLDGGGDGTGLSDLGCPSVIAGGLGLADVDPPALCTEDNDNSCTDIEATYLQLGDTSDYIVSSIEYNPPYQYECLANPISVGTDDIFSPIINLPFDFCFYGSTFNSCVVGSNGIISFDTSLANTGSGYTFDNNLPSTTGDLFTNSIYGVYHDIDPSVGGEIGWELITLNSGCRALVASWYKVPMYSDNSLLYTGMMVLYENTNIIEVYIEEKNIDGTWNDGNAIVGIQNYDATQAVIAPGRNTLDSNWETTNEAWRFTPNGSSITSLTWYEGEGVDGAIIGNSDILNVCPTETTVYTAEIIYTLCDGSTISQTEDTIVSVDSACTSCEITLETGNDNQLICKNTAIEEIVYKVEGDVIGVEFIENDSSGLNGSFNSIEKTYTISGIPFSTNGTISNFSITTIGCSGNIETTGSIEIENCVISKGISPNGDGLNDTWDLSGFDVRKVQIFDRYGIKLYSKNNYTNEWDGTSNGIDLPTGAYYYLIDFNNNTTETGWVYINK